MKKLLAIVLCIAMLIPCITALASAEEAPLVIYLRGSTDIMKFNEDGTTQEIYDDGEYVFDLVFDAVPLLPGAMISSYYDNYAKAILDVMAPAYDAFRPSLEDGSVPEDTRPDWYWNQDTIEEMLASSTYYPYHLDDRLSPYVVAEDLHNFIEALRATSGIQKIYLYARCLGPVALMTYLHEYESYNNFADVAGVMLSFSTHQGMALTDSIFTGNVEITQATLSSWLNNADISDIGMGDEVTFVLKELLVNIGKTLGLKMTAKEINKLYIELKDVLFKPLLKEYYALCIMNLCCINEKYDDMMNYLFSDEGDDEKYAYLIGEVKRYHEEVYPEINNMLATIKEQGKPMVIMADYGGQQYPLNEEAQYLGDFQVGTKAQSLGATTAKIGYTLSEEYINSRINAGFGKYISPDKKIDASTCAFPDNTFFIANINHTWPAKYAEIEESFMLNNMTINSDEAYPQFLYWDEENETLIPLADTLDGEVEIKTPDEKMGIADYFRNFVALIKNFFKAISALLASI